MTQFFLRLVLFLSRSPRFSFNSLTISRTSSSVLKSYKIVSYLSRTISRFFSAVSRLLFIRSDRFSFNRCCILICEIIAKIKTGINAVKENLSLICVSGCLVFARFSLSQLASPVSYFLFSAYLLTFFLIIAHIPMSALVLFMLV